MAQRKDNRSICLSFSEEDYSKIVRDTSLFRKELDWSFEETPELFPEGFAQGYQLKDIRESKKQELPIRRILLRNGESYSIRPSFVMPYMTGRTDDVEPALRLRKWGVPYYALAETFGHNAMYWYRLELSLGRNSIVGTTVRKVDIPEHLAADEHHQTLDGQKVFIATTVADGCCLGASVTTSASTEDLHKGYDVFRQEAIDVEPEYEPKTVSTDGWWGTQGAWKWMFPAIVVLLCFLHAWLKIRDVGKHLGSLFFDVGAKVWNAFRAPNRRTFAQRIRRLRDWAQENLKGIVLEKVLDLCKKKLKWMMAYDHPNGHRKPPGGMT